MMIRPYQHADEDEVVALWHRSGLTRPWNDPRKDIRRKLSVQAEWFLVGCLSDRVVGSVMAGYDGHRGWINYLAVDPEHQRSGYGRALMERAERLLVKAGCPKINLQIRKDNAGAIAFYEQIGFGQDAVISFGKRLIDDQRAIADQILYKVLPAVDWEQAESAGVFSGCGIDLTDGFIHLSSHDQLVATVRLYFKDQEDLLLLSVDGNQLGDSLRWEASRNGALFPHVYGVIPLTAVIAVDRLDLGSDGEHRFPDSFS